MRPRAAILTALFACFLSGLLVAQDPPATLANDVLLLTDANLDHYQGDHEAAQRLLNEFLARHPYDPLALWMLVNDRFIQLRKDGGKLPNPPGEYERELGMVNEALNEIVIHRGCGPTLKAFADGTLDCDYLRAALYLFRVGIRGENEGWWSKRGAIEEDEDAFQDAAKRSHAPQVEFLLGMHEYTASEQGRFSLGGIGVRLAKIPHSRTHAIQLIVDSLRDNSSPFVDDIYFFIFTKERRSAARNEKSDFEDFYPLVDVAKHLNTAHGRNPEVREYCSTARCGIDP